MRLVPVPEGQQLGWNFTAFSGIATISDKSGNNIQGTVVSVDNVRYAKLTSRFGDLTIGHNGRYGQWAFEENGGPVTVLYTIDPDGELLVAGGYEMRLLINDGETMFTPPGGFSLNRELPEEAAKRETLEETGVHINNLIKVGEGTPNRAFWIKQPDGNWPQIFFACKVEWSALAKKGKQVYLPSTKDAIAEIDNLSKLVFMPVIDAIDTTNDEIAISAFAKTMTAFKKGRIS